MRSRKLHSRRNDNHGAVILLGILLSILGACGYEHATSFGWESSPFVVGMLILAYKARTTGFWVY